MTLNSLPPDPRLHMQHPIYTYSFITVCVDIGELRKARLYDKNLNVPQSQCQNASGELGDVGGGGRLRCLHGKVDTTISCMCTCSVGSAQCSGCVVYGPGAMAAI